QQQWFVYSAQVYLCGKITAPHTDLACILHRFQSVSLVLCGRRYFLMRELFYLSCVSLFFSDSVLDVTLDPDTANPYLILSDDGKQVSYGDIKQDVPENPKRFDNVVCVLAKQGFSSGRFYYEVQVKGKTGWDLGVARESITRKGTFTYTPENGFWAVILRNENQYRACDNPPVSLSLREKPEIVGVFVDYEEGLVSFYNTFTEKLYPYFSPYLNKGGKNSKPLIISSVS
uniref:B30.2/SPRY domain-containing protein n=1 Tax=Cyprinus carpio TaxID=7962 RepID=A0A8C2CTM5_CYPCA